MKWYIVQSYSGFEKKVSDQIKEELSKAGMESNFGEVLVPTHDVTEIKKGKRTVAKKKYFPGYVLAKLDLNDQVYHLIKSIKMKTILSILNLLLISNILIAQGNIEGQIFSKSSENLTPLSGVNIYWLSTSKGTISNEDGKFSISVSLKSE